MVQAYLVCLLPPQMLLSPLIPSPQIHILEAASQAFLALGGDPGQGTGLHQTNKQ